MRPHWAAAETCIPSPTLRHCANIGDPPRGGDVGVASLRSIITKGCASWYPCDARPRISGMILLELPILGSVDLSSL